MQSLTEGTGVCKTRGFHIGDGVNFDRNFFDDVKVWSGLFFDTHQLGVRSNFDVDVKILLSTSNF